MEERTTGTPIDDIAYLARSEHRAPTLIALTVRSRSRSELWGMTGVSESTIRRTLSELEDRGWVSRDGYQYEVTQLGAFVASAMADLIDRYTSAIEAAGFSVTEVRENSQYEFVSERAANACQKYGVKSIALGATR